MDVAKEPKDSAQLALPACTIIADCPLPTDIVLVSSDGVQYGAHSKNLGEFTGGFPQDIMPAQGEEVQMPDLDSKALPLFLQYVHHHRQPDLSNVNFSTLRDLAEAVEKYDVYSATEVCKAYMSLSAKDHPVEVFQYAAKHGYRNLMDDAGEAAVQNKTLSLEVRTGLRDRPYILIAWFEYNEYWLSLFEGCYKEPLPVLHRGGEKSCELWWKFRDEVVSQLKHEIDILSSFRNIVEDAKHHLSDCRHCCMRADQWKSRVGLPWDIRKFTSFL